jgi:NAD-dependent SIR2 family protein deacetylase
MIEKANIELLKFAAEQIKLHRSLLITAGVGMSLESGFPNYRDQDQLYKAYPKLKDLGFKFDYCVSNSFFEKYPHKAWYFFGDRYNLYKNSIPHNGYNILDNIQKKHFKNNYFIKSSNVDGHFLHSDLDFSKKKLFELHGSINYNQCDTCKTIIRSELDLNFDHDKGEVLELPKCKKCNKMLRPNIKLSGDVEFNQQRFNKQFENYKSFYKNLHDFVILEIGAGTLLPIIRNYGEELINSKRHKCTMIRINNTDASIKYGSKLNVIDKSNIHDYHIDKHKNVFIGIQMKCLDALEELNKWI